MRKKIIFVFVFFILTVISTSNVLICYANMNNIDNGILKVEYDRIYVENPEEFNEKRDQLYNDRIPLSDEDRNEVMKDSWNIDYTGVDITDNDFSDCDYFDIQGNVDGSWRSTTYENFGYFSVIKVNDYAPRLMKFDNYVINTIQCDVETEFVHDGNFVKVEYILKNVGDVEATVSLGAYADIQIGDNDCARVERIGDSEGIKMYDQTDNLQFTFYGKNRDYVTNIDRLWLGLYPHEETHFFNQNNVNVIEKNDTSFSFSWVDRKIAVGETQKFSVLIGIGKLTSIPIIEFDSEQSDYFQKSNVKVNTIVKDNDENSEAEVFYQVDNSEEQEKTELKKLENGIGEFEIDLNEKKLQSGKHHIKVWARDNQGNNSNIVEKDFYIVSLEKPIVDMSEEWSKETRKFKVLDNKNNLENNRKYYYRLNEGEWIETQLDKEEIALEETGEAKVEAKVVNTSDDEYVISDAKIAKVDKKAPVENHVSIVDGVLTITAKDEHSGLKEILYDLTDKEEPKESLDEYSKYEDGAILSEKDNKNDLYLHFISSDNVDNLSINKVFIPFPQKVEIDVKKEFKNDTPNFKFNDTQTIGDFPFTYEIQINDGEVKNGNPNIGYDIINPLNGKNVIRIKKKDVLGRVSEVAVAEFNYKYTKDDDSDTSQNSNSNNTNSQSKNTNSSDTQDRNNNNTNNSNSNNTSNDLPNPNNPNNSNDYPKQTTPVSPNKSNTSNEDKTTTTTDGTKTYFVASKDDTTAKNPIPKAGSKRIIVLMIVTFIILAISSFTKYKKSES